MVRKKLKICRNMDDYIFSMVFAFNQSESTLHIHTLAKICVQIPLNNIVPTFDTIETRVPFFTNPYAPIVLDSDTRLSRPEFIIFYRGLDCIIFLY